LFIYTHHDNEYFFLSAYSAFRRKCKLFLIARMQIMPLSEKANISIRPWCNLFIQVSSMRLLHAIRMQILPPLRMQKLHEIL